MMTYSPRIVVLEGKHPSEVVDYSLDFAGWLVDGETLQTLSSCAADSGLTIGAAPAPAISGTEVVFWASGGTTGATYAGETVVVTSGGRTLVADWQITVTDPTP